VTGPATAAILYQRGITPLHASAVAIENDVLGFLAASGVGKSSLAAYLVDGGAELVTDDVLVLSREHDAIFALPGSRRLRLDEDSRRRFACGSRDLEVLDARVKQAFIPSHGRVVAGQKPLRAIFLLDKTNPGGVEPVSGFELFYALQRLVYRPQMVRPLGAEAGVFAHLGQLAASVPAYRLGRGPAEWAVPRWSELVSHIVGKRYARGRLEQD
jgi:hypothetical protein